MMTDPRNQHVKYYINGRFVSQYEAAIPLFDAGFLHGKQVWSAPRLINNHIFRFQDHLDKIRHSAEINFFPDIPSDEVIINAVREGQIIMDGPKDHVLSRLSQTNQQRS